MEITTSLNPLLRVSRYVTLGDGCTVLINIYRAIAIWAGRPRPVQVMGTEDVALIGMSPLYGYRVIMDVIDGGVVSIEAKKGISS